MKRIVILVLIALAVTMAVSAQSYTVQKVTGRVQREAGASRVDVAVGDVLSADTVIHTGVGGSLELNQGGRTFTVPAGQNGRRLADVLGSGSGVRIGGNVTQTGTGTASRSTGQVSTASARASDAAEDDDIAAE